MLTIQDLFTKPSVLDRATASYASMQTNVDAYARTLSEAGKPLTAAVARHRAAIARRALRAEQIDPPDSDPKWCSCLDCWRYLCREAGWHDTFGAP